MTAIQLLDCTLRDGMYITDFVTDDGIKKPTVQALEAAGIEIIEVGFLQNIPQAANSAVYESLDAMDEYIAPKKANVIYSAIMMLPAEVPVIERKDSMIDAIRIAFRKEDISHAFELAAEAGAKGYLVMLQPVVTGTYSHDELLNLIDLVNGAQPYSFAVVDSHGNMLPHDANKIADLYQANLDSRIRIGFHFHNNMQQAFANVLSLLNRKWEHDLVIDCSIFGMGRGAGNLPVELAADYLNREFGKNYNLLPLFEAFEAHYSDIYKRTPWGYSLRHLASAVNDVNPFNATYLNETHGLCASDLMRLFTGLADEEKARFIKAKLDERAAEFKKAK